MPLGSAFDLECRTCLHWEGEHGRTDSACTRHVPLTADGEATCAVCRQRQAEHPWGNLTAACTSFITGHQPDPGHAA